MKRPIETFADQRGRLKILGGMRAALGTCLVTLTLAMAACGGASRHSAAAWRTEAGATPNAP